MNYNLENEINKIRDQMNTLIEEDYKKNYKKILKLSQKMDLILNKAYKATRSKYLIQAFKSPERT